MRIKYIYILTTVMFLCCSLVSTAQEYRSKAYSNERPLIFEDAWDYWPFSFINEEGDPRGYNIDILKEMLKRLDIPYVIRLKHPAQVLTDLKDGNADLICSIKGNVPSEISGKYGDAVLTLMGYSIMAPKKTQIQIQSLNDLRDQSIYIHMNGYTHQLIKQYGLEKNVIPYDDMKELCVAVSARDSGKVLYNTQSLQWLINKCQLTNMRLTPVNIPYAEYRFASRDTVLLERLDSLYEAMTANNEIDKLQHKWFRQYNEQESWIQKLSGITWFWIVSAIIAGIIIVYHHIMYLHVKSVRNKKNKMFKLYMHSARLTLWIYDVDKDVFNTIDAEGSVSEQYTQTIFSVFYRTDDFTKILRSIDNLVHGHSKAESLQVRYHLPNDAHNEIYYGLKICVLKEVKGRPTMLLGIQQDMTEKNLKTKKLTETRIKFQTVFNSTQMDVIYFDKNGAITDINPHAMTTFGIKDKEDLLCRKLIVKNIPTTQKALDASQWLCKIINTKEILCNNGYMSNAPAHDMYYERIILPIYDHNEDFTGTFEVGYDKTHVVKNLHEKQEQTTLIKSMTTNMNQLINSVNKVLLSNQIYQAKYDIEKRTLTIVNDDNGKHVTLSELECVYLLDTESRSKALNFFIKMSKGVDKTFKLLTKTILKDKDGKNIYYNTNAMPIHTKDGNVAYYLCLLRNETKKVEEENMLSEKEQKAQEAIQLQKLFLKNLSTQIRTPLNTIFSSSETFKTEHNIEDEPMLVAQIKENTNNILSLVNDILLLSRLESDMHEMHYEDTDIVGIFKFQCNMDWSATPNPAVRKITECPYSLLYGQMDIDSFTLIINNLCMLAAINTTAGYIKATMDYHHDTLFIKIIDTGGGFSNEQKNNLYEINTNNSDEEYRIKLKLMICKLLTEKLGGTFEIDSQPGYGTTVWFTIPFQSTITERETAITPNTEGNEAKSNIEETLITEDSIMTDDYLSLLAKSEEGGATFLDDSDSLLNGTSFLDSIYN